MNRSFLSLLIAVLPLAVCAQLSVHTDFEGGSGKVLSLDSAGGVIRLMPGGDISRGWPCWWSIRIDGATPGREITLELVPSDQAQKQPGAGQGKPLSASWSRPERPSVSPDGVVWRHGEPGVLLPDRMTYRIKPETATLWIAWGPAFTATTAKTLIDQAAQSPRARPFVLATTREGRPVHAVRVAEGPGKPALWLQARQHAWESGGSWVGAGILEWLLSGDPLANQLCDQCEIVLVPLMDVDHVTTGDGGKDALPQDHNRDWQDQPHWPEVAAAQRHLLAYAKEKRLRVFCDLHNPGPSDKKAFFFVSPKDIISPASWETQHHFIDLTREEFAGNPIPLEITPRESGPGYHPLWRQISKNWVHSQCGDDVLSVTLETAWNTPGSTVEGYKKTGAALGRALARHLAATRVRVAE
ncbi:MAG TPA: M14 family zinc carboxypeptidase [Prosthecobacter sp.]|nr:M14 family zinc carboxypeptidase [Prosthecobacter sp.]